MLFLSTDFMENKKTKRTYAWSGRFCAMTRSTLSEETTIFILRFMDASVSGGKYLAFSSKYPWARIASPRADSISSIISCLLRSSFLTRSITRLIRSVNEKPCIMASRCWTESDMLLPLFLVDELLVLAALAESDGVDERCLVFCRPLFDFPLGVNRQSEAWDQQTDTDKVPGSAAFWRTVTAVWTSHNPLLWKCLQNCCESNKKPSMSQRLA